MLFTLSVQGSCSDFHTFIANDLPTSVTISRGCRLVVGLLQILDLKTIGQGKAFSSFLSKLFKRITPCSLVVKFPVKYSYKTWMSYFILKL